MLSTGLKRLHRYRISQITNSMNRDHFLNVKNEYYTLIEASQDRLT